MFEKFKTLFSKQEETHSPAEEFYGLSPYENPNFITEPEKIASLLSEIEISSPLCSVKIDGSDEEFSSSILGVKADKDLIILDELIPKEGNALARSKKTVKLSTFHKGIHLSFSLNDIESGSSRGISYYKAKLPDRIYYPQRRRSPRIEISSIDISFTGVSERTGINVSGYLFDLSRGGAGIDLSVNRARIQRGDRIKNCRITFEDYLMEFDFAIRFVRPASPSTGKIQIGGFYENLSSKSQTKLSYFITSLERVEIRKQKS